MNTNAQRVYLITNDGLFRSDDGGATWQQMDADDTRIRNGQGGYNCGVYVDPKNPDVVYTFNTASYKSTRRRQHLHRLQGRAGRRRSAADVDRSHQRPAHPPWLRPGRDRLARRRRHVELVVQPVDRAGLPRRRRQLASRTGSTRTQQDAGAIRTRSPRQPRRDHAARLESGERLGVGHRVPDPLDPNTVYASGNGIIKITYPSEQWINVSPARTRRCGCAPTSSQPLVFGAVGPARAPRRLSVRHVDHRRRRALDEDQPRPRHPASVTTPPDSATPKPGAPAPRRDRSRSPRRPSRTGTIWVGTNNGLIKVTRDNGKTWTDVVDPGLPYAGAGSSSRRSSRRTTTPARRTRRRLHARRRLRAVRLPHARLRQDVDAHHRTVCRRTSRAAASRASCATIPKRAGLLFAGTESGMYVSFDDGDQWQSLHAQPADDVVPRHRDQGQRSHRRHVRPRHLRARRLRRAAADRRRPSPTEPVHLFKPDAAVRVRRNVGADTPFPPEVPHALNPPDGAIIVLLARLRAVGRDHARRARCRRRDRCGTTRARRSRR